MANKQHLNLLKQSVETWNQWRREYAAIQVDLIRADLSKSKLNGANLSRADLSGTNLSGAELKEANLSRADLSGANLRRANLWQVDLSGAKLNGADLSEAFLHRASLWRANLRKANLRRASLKQVNLSEANLSEANLSEADLSEADLSRATLKIDFSGANFSGANLSRTNLSGLDLSEIDFNGANMSGANLSRAILVKTNLENANLTDCAIHGISVWNVQLKNATQSNLTITGKDEPTITVDNLDVAQFIYLLLNNENIRHVIDTITYKVVLLLGRFTLERKEVLDAVREALRTCGYLPILFDFDKPSSRDFTETVRTLAHLSRFIIADLTDPSSIPQELQAIVPNLAVPVQPVLLEGKREYAMFVDFLKTYHWVLPVHYYLDQANLLTTLEEYVIVPAEQKAQELEKR